MTDNDTSSGDTEQLECEHCGSEFGSTYAWEMHILAECPDATQEHKEWINGGEWSLSTDTEQTDL